MSAVTQGIELAERIAVTDRGALYRVAGDPASVARVIDPRHCDGRFREALDQIRRAGHPSMAPIAGEGWIGSDFFLLYRLDGRWETLAARFARQHWRLRVNLVARLCDLVPEWAGAPLHSIGLSSANIVMLELSGAWFPFLLPCPALEYSSPSEWFDVSPAALAAVAPEVVRGLPPDYRAVDMYAVGTILWEALGAAGPQGAPEELVELQARNAAFSAVPEAPAVEPVFRDLDAFKVLIETARRCTHTSVLVRRVPLTGVKAACEAAFAATDPVAMAKVRIAAADSREALRILEWGFATFGEDFGGRMLAADLCEKIEDLPRAVGHLTAALALEPGQMALRLRRADLLWLLYLRLPPLEPGAADPDGDSLLSDLKVAKMLAERNETAPFLRAAAVYRRRGDLYSAAEELCAASEREESDMAALFLYAGCLRDMGCPAECAEAVGTARYRLDRMCLSEMMSQGVADSWRRKFDSLL